MIPLITFPGRPVNGGPLGKASPKFGDWACEPKINGWRALMHAPTGQLWNRHGEPLSIAATFREAIAEIQARCTDADLREAIVPDWLDLEVIDRRHGHMRGSIIVLDVVCPVRYTLRRDILAGIFPLFDYGDTRTAGVGLIPSHPWSLARSLYADLERFNAQFDPNWRKTPLNAVFEGIVAKHRESKYPIQLRSASEGSPFWVKHRFA